MELRLRGGVWLAVGGMVLALAGPVHAADYWVSNDGDDGDDGLTEESAWETLIHAAEQVGPGDTIHVLDGDYEGFYLETSGAPGQPITFLAEGDDVRARRSDRQRSGVGGDPAAGDRRPELRAESEEAGRVCGGDDSAPDRDLQLGDRVPEAKHHQRHAACHARLRVDDDRGADKGRCRRRLDAEHGRDADSDRARPRVRARHPSTPDAAPGGPHPDRDPQGSR